MMTVALYPWEDVDMLTRERAEEDIWSDEEYQAWLDDLLSDEEPVEDEAHYIPFQMPAALYADVLPAYQRDDYFGD